MPFAVRQIVERKAPLETIAPDAVATKAIRRMHLKDYTQLAVVESSRLLGLVSHQSILEAVVRFGCRVEQLFVRDAVTKARTIPPDGDLSDLLELLAQAPAVIVVDREGHIHGIVTDYDTTAWFREDIEDRLNWEDVELGLKQLVAESFAGKVDSEDAKSLIKKVTQQDNRSKFLKAISKCADKFDHQRALAAYEEHFGTGRDFGRLTFYEYSQLFTERGRWAEHFRPIFGEKREQIAELLRRVGEARNQIAHLREVDEEQREELRFCAEWISRIRPTHGPQVEISEERPLSGLPEVASSAVSTQPHDGEAMPSYLEDQETADRVSTYFPITSELRRQPVETHQVEYTFEAIERVLQSRLPPSARRHRAWWANDTTSHVQAQAWLDAGWRAVVNLGAEKVTFTRIQGRQTRYIQFFNALLAEIRAASRIPTVYSAAQGRSWAWIAALKWSNATVGWLAASFTITGQFRVEAYLDTGDEVSTKQVFEALHSDKQRIEADFGAPLVWERLDGKRASRIARYWQRRRITDPDDELTALRSEATGAAGQLYGSVSAALTALPGHLASS